VSNFLLGAAAKFQQEKFDETVEDCNKAIELSPEAMKVSNSSTGFIIIVSHITAKRSLRENNSTFKTV